MGWSYTLLAAIGELLMIWGLKQRRRLVMGLALLISALVTGYFLDRAFVLLDSSSVYPVWVSIGSVGSLLLGYFAYDEKLSRTQLAWIAVLMTGCTGLFMGGS